MAKPVPTSEQLAAINQEKSNLTAQQASLLESSTLQDVEIARMQHIDDAFKALFDWYDQNIIAKYDAERKAINGVFPVGVVTEADLQAVAANPPTGRLVPTYPATDIVRISEFDGAPTSYTSLNELQHMVEQLVPENKILVGFGGTSPVVNGTTRTKTAITPGSTTVEIEDTASTATFAVGNRFVIHDGISSVLVEVTSVLDTTPIPTTGTCSLPDYTSEATCTANNGTWMPDPIEPPYSYTLGIIQIVSGSVNAGALIDPNFTTFTDAERALKTPDPYRADYQNIMNHLVSELQIPLNARLARLAEQLTALNANEDPYGVADIAAAKDNVIANQTFLTNYLVTTDISDAGMNLVINDRITRTAQANARVAQIVAAYTGQTENFYDQRYNVANNRASLAKGTLRSLENAVNTKTSMVGMAENLQGAIDALNGIIS